MGIGAAGLSGSFLAAAILLAAAGLGKLRNPDAVVPALGALRLPDSRTVVRCLAIAEIGLGTYAVLAGDPLAATALGLAYAAFAAGILLLLHRGHTEISCGCFGVEGTPIGRLHVVVNVLLAAVCLAASADPSRLQSAADLGTARAAAFLLVVGSLSYGFFLLLSQLPLLVRLVTVSAAESERSESPETPAQSRSGEPVMPAVQPGFPTEVRA